MKAIVYHKYGSPDVLEIQDVDKPVPAEDEVLVRVCATSVNPVDWYGMIGLFIGRPGSGLRRPKDPRLGADYAGVIEAVSVAQLVEQFFGFGGGLIGHGRWLY